MSCTDKLDHLTNKVMTAASFLTPFRFLILLLIIAFQLSCNPLANHDFRPDKPRIDFSFSADIRLSPDERRAGEKLESMREQLLNRNRHNWSFFTSFIDWKDRIVKEELYRTLEKMPKGGILHLHATATGDASWIIDRALNMPECYIYWGNKSDNYVTGQLGFFPDRQIPTGWFRISEINASRPQLKDELIRLYTIGPEDDSIPDIWTEFEAIFQRTDGFVSFRPVFIDFYRHAFETLGRDGIQFAELRTSIDPILNEDGSWTTDEHLLNLYQEIVMQVNESYPGFTLGIVACAWKGETLEAVRLKFERAKVLKAKYPGLIVGFDLVGEEDANQNNGYFASVVSSNQIPLYLHGGESLSPANHNIQDAINMHSLRISHGINLVNFPDLERTMIRNSILLEVCPISNQVLGYVTDMREHPALNYLRHGLQCSIGSDDPSIFRSSGLTDDFFVAYVSWRLDLRSVKKLILNSITFSGMPVEQKQKQLDEFNIRWKIFIKSVIQ